MKIRKFNTALKRINYLELAVYYIGQAQLDQAWHGKSSALPVNRLYFAGSGEAFIGIDGKYEALEPGFVYLVPVGTPMDFYCDGNMEKIYVHFNLFRPDHYDSLDGLNQIYRIPFSAQEYENLQLHAARGNFADTLIVKDVLYQTLAQFQEHYSIIDEHVPIYSKSVMNTIAYVQENLSANLHLEDLAKHAYVSRSTLTELFRKEVGVSLGKYIDDQLIAAAQRELSQTTRSIGEISNSLGYSNQCYFSRRFKQICGKTPQLYRTQNKA